MTKTNSINNIEKNFYTNPLKKHKMMIKDRILTDFSNKNINSLRDKRFKFSNLNDIKKSDFLNSIPNMSINSESKFYYKPLREREKEKERIKGKIKKDYIKNKIYYLNYNTLSMDFNFNNESGFINHTTNINHMITDKAKMKYINYSNRISHLI